MKPDGYLITSDSKSDLIHVLESLVTKEEDSTEHVRDYSKTVAIVDAMSIVHEVISANLPKTCKDLGAAFTQTIRIKCKHYEGCRVVFDNYGRDESIKDITRRRKQSHKSSSVSFIIEDTTPIHDPKIFLANNKTKDSVTLYLAEKVLQLPIPVVTVTRMHVKTNRENVQPLTDISSQEEADTIMILHAVEVGKAGKGNDVHILTQDTDVLVLALRRFQEIGPKTALLLGKGEKRRTIFLKPIIYIYIICIFTSQ